MNRNRQEKGITLVALVIMIIVLLILAGISISMLTGDNGLLKKADKATEEHSHASVREGIILAYNEYQIELQTLAEETQTKGEVKLASTEVTKIAELNMTKDTTFIGFLEGKEYVDTNGVVDTQELLGSKAKLGNGSGRNDVYIVSFDEENNKYVLTYYYTEDNEISLWGTADKKESESYKYYGADVTPTDTKYFDFIFDEDNKTATLKAVNEDYGVFQYYWGDSSRIVGVSYIIDGTEKITDVVIPYKVSYKGEEFVVTGVGCRVPYSEYYGFRGPRGSEFTSFKLPNTIRSINEEAFYGCSSLTSFTIPGSVTSIGDRAFMGCESLTNITIPSSVKSIGEYVFNKDPRTPSNIVVTLEKGSPLADNIPEDKWGAAKVTLEK